MMQSDKRVIDKYITEKSFSYFFNGRESEKLAFMHSFYADSNTLALFFWYIWH